MVKIKDEHKFLLSWKIWEAKFLKAVDLGSICLFKEISVQILGGCDEVIKNINFNSLEQFLLFEYLYIILDYKIGTLILPREDSECSQVLNDLKQDNEKIFTLLETFSRVHFPKRMPK